MIEARIALGGMRYVRQDAPRPLAYLDHGPMGQIAENDAWRDGLVAALRRRGTLGVSSLNLYEVSQQDDGASVDAITRFLTEVDQRFVLIDLCPSRVIARARAPRCSEVQASFDDSFAEHYVASLSTGTGPTSAAGLVPWIRAARAFARSAFAGMRRDVQSQIAAGREVYGRLPSIRPLPAFSSRLDGCMMNLMHHACLDGAEFTDHDSADIFHADVPAAICDFALLDGKWAPRALRLDSPPRRAQVFSGKKGQIEAFLDALERFQPTPEVK